MPILLYFNVDTLNWFLMFYLMWFIITKMYYRAFNALQNKTWQQQMQFSMINTHTHTHKSSWRKVISLSHTEIVSVRVCRLQNFSLSIYLKQRERNKQTKMKLTAKCCSTLAKMLDFYSQFNPSPLSIKKFIDFGEWKCFIYFITNVFVCLFNK